jgi:UDP-N-acetylglucosamine--N-acetylmuramyl-(pentapeptide) pyrophosphoryl-undecaprenol N-acetylglucosamine transferase
VPYPYSGQHQTPNAIYMERNGAARMLPDAELGEELVPTVLGLLEDEETLANMQESARAMARPDAAEAITQQLWSMARQHAIRTSFSPAKGPDEQGTRS